MDKYIYTEKPLIVNFHKFFINLSRTVHQSNKHIKRLRNSSMTEHMLSMYETQVLTPAPHKP